MHYLSSDKIFGLQLDSKTLKVMLEHIAKAGDKETGGILIGFYSKGRNLAIVKCISGPPSDSKSGRTWFKRGIAGLQHLLNEAWNKNLYYLGEWHFHPYASPNPSPRDKNQMEEIARSKQYQCPEPILLIIGGNPVDYDIKVFVVLPNKEVVELIESGI